MLALRFDGRGSADSRVGVPRSPPTPTSCSRHRQADRWPERITRDAAQLDWPLRRRADRLRGRRLGDVKISGLHDPRRHDLRRAPTSSSRRSTRWCRSSCARPSKRAEIDAFAEKIAARASWTARADAKKEGIFTGAYARNPFTGEQVPIWVANFVARRLRHRRRDERSRARPARLRVREASTACPSSPYRAARRRQPSATADAGVHRRRRARSTPARIHRPASTRRCPSTR